MEKTETSLYAMAMQVAKQNDKISEGAR